jgi:hypothetical protein
MHHLKDNIKTGGGAKDCLDLKDCIENSTHTKNSIENR